MVLFTLIIYLDNPKHFIKKYIIKWYKGGWVSTILPNLIISDRLFIYKILSLKISSIYIVELCMNH